MVRGCLKVAKSVRKVVVFGVKWQKSQKSYINKISISIPVDLDITDIDRYRLTSLVIISAWQGKNKYGPWKLVKIPGSRLAGVSGLSVPVSVAWTSGSVFVTSGATFLSPSSSSSPSLTSSSFLAAFCSSSASRSPSSSSWNWKVTETWKLGKAAQPSKARN